MTTQRHKQGRKSKYKARFAAMVQELATSPESILVRGTLSDTKLGKLFDVDRGTVRRWRTRTPGHESEFQPGFAAACAACQKAVDAGQIQQSMISRARGFVQVKRIRALDDAGKLKVVREEKTTMAGDVAAAKLVLSNIQKDLPESERWDTNDKVDHGIGKSLADFLKDL